MTVARILKEKGRGVATITPETTLEAAVRQLAARNIGALVVVDGGGGVAGIISERDIVRILADHSASALRDPVSRHMTRHVYTCTERHTTAQLMNEMTNHRFRHFPVVENGKLAGIVSIGDVVKQRFAENALETHSLREYITTG